MFLYHHLNKYQLWNDFASIVVGFVDTKLVFKKEIPNQTSYTQVNLMKDLLQETYCAHNALDDVKALKKLCGLVKNKFPSYTVGITDVVNSANTSTYKKTLLPLQTEKAITDSMATKIARAGLNYTHLKLACERNGYDGLSVILGEKINGVVQVTKHGPVIQRIFEHFSK